MQYEPDCHYAKPVENNADSFTVAMPRLTFGRGCLNEIGARASAIGLKQVALFTDPHLLNSNAVQTVTEALKKAGVQFALFHDIRIEPDDMSVRRGVEFLHSGHFDGVISVGGGSVMDTAKAAIASAHYRQDVNDFFAPPIGKGATINQALLPHIACPTTAGTGSECTSITVVRISELNAKFVFASPYLLPTIALVDPSCCDTLPAKIVGSTGFDLLCHALESYTARAYTRYPKIADPNARQYLQGANPFSDIIVAEAMKRVGSMLERGVRDASDYEARDSLSFAATLAGIGFGNTATHVPHAMSYGITHLMRNITTDDYPITAPFVPHGISVITNAPSIFAYTAIGAPQRHLQAAQWLGADINDATPNDAGEVLSKRLIELMRITDMPNGLQALGFTESDITPLTQSSMRQARAIQNCSREINAVDMENMYRGALQYW